MFRAREPICAELGLGRREAEAEAIALMVEGPALLRRPVAVWGDGAVPARLVEPVEGLFG